MTAMFFGKKAFYNRMNKLMWRRKEADTKCYVKSLKKRIKCAAKSGWDHITVNHFLSNLSADVLDEIYEWFTCHGFTVDREVGTIYWR